MTAAAILSAFAVLISLQPAVASEPDWPDGPFQYLVVDQGLRDVLTEFGRRMGLPIQIGADIEDRRVRGLPPAVNARAFLLALCDRYGLAWRYDGTVLHVETLRARAAQALSRAAKSADRLSEPGTAANSDGTKDAGRLGDDTKNTSDIGKLPRPKVLVIRGK